MNCALAPRGRRWAALLALLGALLAVLSMAGPAAADQRPTLAPDESLSDASQAAGWLSSTAIGGDGAVRGRDGQVDPVTTAWAALALHAAGLDRESEAPTRWLRRNVNALATENGRDSPAGLAMLILVARAQDRPPASFGRTDLVARLLATRQPDGLFGPPVGPRLVHDPLGGVPSRQGLVLSALGAAGRTDAGAAAWLEQRQCAQGGWQFDRVDPRAACEPDPITTGYAIQGLAAIGREVPPMAVDALAAMQDPDGGFPLFPHLTDAMGTAVGLQGLIAAGQDPNTQRWRRGAGADATTPFGALLRFDTDPSGGFSLVPHTPADPALTARVVIAAAGQPLPLAALTGQSGDNAGDNAPSDSASSSGTGGGGDSFSVVPLLAVGAVALAVVGGVYVYRRRRQAL